MTDPTADDQIYAVLPLDLTEEKHAEVLAEITRLLTVIADQTDAIARLQDALRTAMVALTRKGDEVDELETTLAAYRTAWAARVADR